MIRRLALSLALLTPIAAAQEPDAPCRIHGRFVDVDGAPVAGARVTVNGSEGWRDATVRKGRTDGWEDPAIEVSDAEGGFEFSFVPPRDYRFSATVEHPELGRIGWRWDSLATGKTIDLGDVLLEPRAVLTGHLVDAEGELLVEGWGVMVTHGRGLDAPRVVQTSFGQVDPETGSFRVDDLPPGELVVVGVNVNRQRLDEVLVDALPGVVTEVELVREGPKDTRRLLLSVRASFGVRPAPGTVYASDVDGSRIPLEPVPGRASDWQALDLEPGTYVVVIDDPRFVRWRSDAVHTGVREVVHLRGSSALRLDVRRSEDGARFEKYGLSVRYEPKVVANRIAFSFPDTHTLSEDGARAPADGLYAGLTPGDLVLELRVAGYATERVTVKALQPGETRAVAVTLGRGRSLEGRVVQPNGHAANGVRVELTRGERSDRLVAVGVGLKMTDDVHRRTMLGEQDVVAVTDVAGHFLFEDLADGRYTLRAVGGPLAMVDLPIVIAGSDVDAVVLKLPPTSSVKVKITLPDGLEFTNPRVIPALESTSHSRSYDGVELGPDGTCRVEGLPAGEHLLRLRIEPLAAGAPPTMTLDLGTVHVRAGESVTHSADLRPGFPAWGRVRVTIDGAPAGKRLVSFVSEVESELGSSMFLDEEGAGPPVWSAPGNYRLRVIDAANGWCLDSAERFVLEPARAFAIELDVPLVRGTLRALDRDGAPLAATELCWWGEDVVSDQARATTDAKGELALALPPGKYSLARGDALMQNAQFEWKDGATAVEVSIPAKK